MNKLTWIAGTLGIAALATGLGGAAWAAKGGHGGGGGGGGSSVAGTLYYNIYFHDQMRTMDAADGGNQTQFGTGTYGAVSLKQYGDHWYFLQLKEDATQLYPSGQPRKDLVVRRDDYAPDNVTALTEVQLTHDDTLTLDPWFRPEESLRWLPGKDAVTYTARRWQNGTVIGGGVYEVQFTVDANGNITGNVAEPTTQLISFPVDLIGPYAYPWPVVGWYDWFPDGHVIGFNYAFDSAAGLWKCDDLGSSPQLIVDADASMPSVSPDGGMLAFRNANGGLSTVKSDGTHLRQIASSTSWGYGFPVWSPDGQNIAFEGQTSGGGILTVDVFRCSASGGGITNVTNTPGTGSNPGPNGEHIRAWR